MSAVVLVTVVRSSADVNSTRTLIRSLHQFGGRLAQIPVWAFHTDRDSVSSWSTLEAEGAELHEVYVPETLLDFPLAAKVAACAAAEQMVAEGTRALLWCDPCCLVIREPMGFDVQEKYDVAVRPVHIRNVGSLAEESLDPYWGAIYRVIGLAESEVTVRSFVDRCRLRAYFNTHAIAVRPAMRLFSRWWEVFQRLAQDEEFSSGPGRSELHRIFLHQAVLSALIAKIVRPERINSLPTDYNYPLHLHHLVNGADRVERLDDLTLAVYEEDDLGGSDGEAIEISRPLQAWLVRNGAIRHGTD